METRIVITEKYKEFFYVRINERIPSIPKKNGHYEFEKRWWYNSQKGEIFRVRKSTRYDIELLHGINVADFEKFYTVIDTPRFVQAVILKEHCRIIKKTPNI